MKYFEFIIEERSGEYEFLSPPHIIEAETEEQAYEYADAYLKDFRGVKGAIKEGEYTYSWNFGSIWAELSGLSEIDNINEWMKVQRKRMTLKYDQKFVDSMKEEEDDDEETAQEIAEVKERNNALNEMDREDKNGNRDR